MTTRREHIHRREGVMADKTLELWEVARHAFYETLNQRALAGQDETEVPAWQAAAEAVAVKVLREQPNVIIADHELHPDAKAAIMETTRKYDDVIEAANAAKEDLIYFIGDTGSPKVGDLLDALEALQEVEGE